MTGSKLTIFVVAENSQGETEILAFDISATQDQIDNGDHYDIAKSKAEEDGYDALAVFDSSDMAGQQLFGKRPMYGDEPRFIKGAKLEVDAKATALTDLQRRVIEVYENGEFSHAQSMEDVVACEDTLFLFMVREAGDARDDAEEFIGMIFRAGNQLRELNDAMELYLVNAKGMV